MASDEERENSEEVEPRLKYNRITNDLQKILCKDAASCIAVHPKVIQILLLIKVEKCIKNHCFLFQFICLGSHWGAVHLFDHQGNSVRGQELPAHTVMVNQISIDERGDHIASCSDDGKVDKMFACPYRLFQNFDIVFIGNSTNFSVQLSFKNFN